MPALSDYAQQLGNLKKLYSSSAPNALDDIRKQGLQVRSQANGEGIDLSALEDAANSYAGVSADKNSADEQAFRNSTFSAIKSAPTYRNPTQPTSSVGTGQQPTTTFQNADLNDAHKLMTQLQQLINTPLNFNPETDPTYQAAKTLAQANRKTATQDTLETMNSRGLVNSSITTSQIAQIDQEAENKPLELIPQLQANAVNQRQQGISNIASLAGLMLDSGQDQRNFESDSTFKEAQLTGNYVNPQAKGIIDHILSLKQSAENPWTTSEQLKGLSTQADADRAKLASFGIDPSLFSADVGFADASANIAKLGSRTMQGQQFDQNSANTKLKMMFDTASEYGSLPKGFADEISKIPGMEKLGSFFKQYEGKANLNQQQVDVSKANSARAAANANKEKTMSWDDQSKAATAAYANKIISQSASRADADEFLNDPETRQRMLADGVDFPSLKASMDKIWPPSKPEADKSLEINEKALALAQKDLDYRDGTPEEQAAILAKIKRQLTEK